MAKSGRVLLKCLLLISGKGPHAVDSVEVCSMA